MVDFLLGHGADMLAKDEEQNSPLHVAVENKQTLVVQMLLEAGNPTNLENSVRRFIIFFRLEQCNHILFFF